MARHGDGDGCANNGRLGGEGRGRIFCMSFASTLIIDTVQVMILINNDKLWATSADGSG